MATVRLERGVEIDLERLRVIRDGTERTLTAMEARLLAYLLRAGREVDEAELLREVWGYDPKVRSRTVQTTVGRVRAKLEADPRRPRHLVHATHRGYRLVVPADDGPLGREADAARVLAALREAEVVSLSGLPGMGRSTVARVVAEAWAGPVRVVSSEAEAIEALRSLRERGSALVVADPAFDVERLRSRHRSLRWLLVGHAALGHTVVLGPLSADATRALARRLGVTDEGLVAAIDGWPLVASLAAAWAEGLPAADVARSLREAPLEVVRPPPDRAGRDLGAELIRLVDELPEAERTALDRAAAFAGTFGRAAFEAVCDGEAIDDLRRLEARGLVRVEDGRFRVPLFVRAAEAHSTRDRTSARARVVRWALTVTRTASLDDLAVEADGVEGAIPWASAEERVALVAGLARSWQARGPWDRLERRALEVLAGDPPGAATVWCAVARVRAWSGRLDEAEVATEHALRLAGSDPDVLAAAAEVALLRGRAALVRVRDLAERLLRLAEPDDDRRVGAALALLGNADRYEGTLDRADEHLVEAARRLRRCGARAELSDVLRARSEVARRRGKLVDGRALLQAALAAVDGDHRREAHVVEALALYSAEEGHFDEALAGYGRAVGLHRAVGARRRLTHVLLSIGEVHLAAGRSELARAPLEEALGLAVEFDDPRFGGAIRETLARVAFDDGRPREAVDLAIAAAEAFAALGDHLHAAFARATAGRAFHLLGDLSTAREHYVAAAAAFDGQRPLLVPLLAADLLAVHELGGDPTPILARLEELAGPADRRITKMARTVRAAEPVGAILSALAAAGRDERLLARLLRRLES